MTFSSLRPLFNYVVRVGDALSQLINVVVFFGQNPNESVSGRAYRMRRISWPWAILKGVINFFFFWQHDHCYLAYHADIKRASQTLRDR